MNQNAEVKTVKREEIDDSVAIMPKYLRDCVRWAMNINRDKVMSDEDLEKALKENDEKYHRDPFVIELSWMKYAYTIGRNGRRYTIGINYTNWPSADQAYDFLMKNLDVCNVERVDRVCERIGRVRESAETPAEK